MIKPVVCNTLIERTETQIVSNLRVKVQKHLSWSYDAIKLQCVIEKVVIRPKVTGTYASHYCELHAYVVFDRMSVASSPKIKKQFSLLKDSIQKPNVLS